jgi:toxin-antitoxin system PIN domain toxin
MSLLGFLRIVTNPRAFRTPLTMPSAWQQVRKWLSAETAWTPEPTERHTVVLGKLLSVPGAYGNIVPDAHLAARAIEHGLTLCSTDGDFARFPGLSWRNPLVS